MLVIPKNQMVTITLNIIASIFEDNVKSINVIDGSIDENIYRNEGKVICGNNIFMLLLKQGVLLPSIRTSKHHVCTTSIFI